jgi:hypothetical protein
MYHPASMMGEDQEDEQHLEADGRHSSAVTPTAAFSKLPCMSLYLFVPKCTSCSRAT